MFHKLIEFHHLADLMEPDASQLKLNKWDNDLTDFMDLAEKKCNKFKASHIKYSPEVNIWIRQQQLL